MKQKRSNISKQVEWERLLEANIYIGDHMTRAWTKDGKTATPSPVVTADIRKHNSIPRTCPKSPSGGFPTRTPSQRKSNVKRKPKTTKEILSHYDISNDDLLSWQESFDNLLKNTAGRYVFKSFLESEIADENLKFWLACEELKTMTKQKRAEKMAQSIYDTYINVYSPHEVNIDYKMREDIVDQLKSKLDASVFTQAQHQIYTLMHRDSYPRFLSSQMLTELTAEVLGRQMKNDRSKSEGSLRSPGLMVCCCCRRQTSIRDTTSRSTSVRSPHPESKDPSQLDPRSTITEKEEENKSSEQKMTSEAEANGDTKRPISKNSSVASGAEAQGDET